MIFGLISVYCKATMLPVYSPFEITQAGFVVLGIEKTAVPNETEFMEKYGLTPEEVSRVWSKMKMPSEEQLPARVELKHLLWLLYYHRKGISIVRLKDALNLDIAVEEIRSFFHALETPYRTAVINECI